nr:cation-transporting P-type ATPase [Enterococcus faecium]
MNWYRLTVEDVLKNYQTSTEGLSQEERQKRLTDQGYNDADCKIKLDK